MSMTTTLSMMSCPVARERQDGNVVFIILITIALLGMLTLAISDGGQQQTPVLDKEKSTANAARILQHGSVLAASVQTMIRNGIAIEDIEGMDPNDPDFNQVPVNTKVYHVKGGGVQYLSSVGGSVDPPIIHNIATIKGVGSSDGIGPGNGAEVLMVIDVPQDVCAALNKRITGSETIPPFPSAGVLFRLRTGQLGSADVSDTACPACENQPYLCVAGTGLSVGYYYYHLLYPG